MGLDIINLYQKTDEKKIKNFQQSVQSTVNVKSDYEKVDNNLEWIERMEDTIYYLDNILRNPNRFIINEEDIVKIELARRVTVESIKHLSRNTNLIQDYDKKTGNVRPSKILNINKEESFNTYENRFIYSLIQNMKGFIARKKQDGIIPGEVKDSKLIEYNATTTIGKEKVNMSMQLDSKLDNKSSKNSELDIKTRIEKLELQISDLTSSEVYKTLSKLHVALVTSPIKKTNVILKNVNFQYAEKLWNYLQEEVMKKPEIKKEKKNYQDKGNLKHNFDETFLLNYLIMNKLNNEELSIEEKEEVTSKITYNMVEELMKLNENISEEELKRLVSMQYGKIKYKQVVSNRKIIDIYTRYIKKYLNKIEKIEI